MSPVVVTHLKFVPEQGRCPVAGHSTGSSKLLVELLPSALFLIRNLENSSKAPPQCKMRNISAACWQLQNAVTVGLHMNFLQKCINKHVPVVFPGSACSLVLALVAHE
jgi:hypothetical protein